MNGKIIEPRKEEWLAQHKAERQALKDEFIQRGNTWIGNAQFRGLDNDEIIGLLDCLKLGLELAIVSVKRGPELPKK